MFHRQYAIEIGRKWIDNGGHCGVGHGGGGHGDDGNCNGGHCVGGHGGGDHGIVVGLGTVLEISLGQFSKDLKMLSF